MKCRICRNDLAKRKTVFFWFMEEQKQVIVPVAAQVLALLPYLAASPPWQHLPSDDHRPTVLNLM
jgi:hypothetical protein